MSDLFDKPYPDSPGYKEETTSMDAAVKVVTSAKTLRGRVLAEYQAACPCGMTADEVATRMGKSILSIRPRVTELRRAGEIVPAKIGDRVMTRTNESGMSATVLVIRHRS